MGGSFSGLGRVAGLKGCSERAAEAQTYTHRQIVTIPIVQVAPNHLADFLGGLQGRVRRAEPEDQIVMQMERLSPAGRDAMHIDTGERRVTVRDEYGPGFLDYLAARRVPDLGILRLDVPARQQPAIQPAVMHQ